MLADRGRNLTSPSEEASANGWNIVRHNVASTLSDSEIEMSKQLVDLLQNPTGVGITALAIIGLGYLLRSLFDVVKSRFLPGLYDLWMLKKWKLFLPSAEKVLDSGWTDALYFRDGDPKYIDFKKGCVLVRSEVQSVKAGLERGRFLHLQGLPSSGKTVIALTVAYEALQEGRRVFYFSRPSLIFDELFTFFSNNFVKWSYDTSNLLIIVDDAHLNTAVCSHLFSFFYERYDHAKLLFVSRPSTMDQPQVDTDWHFAFTDYMPKLEITADAAVSSLTDFYSRRKFGHSIPPLVRNIFIHECANDLLLLGRYLRAWDGSPVVHIDIVRAQVLDSIRKDLERLRMGTPEAVGIVLVLGVFYRFEIAVERAFVQEVLKLNPTELVHIGEIRLDNDFLSLHHSSQARLYSNAIQSSNTSEFADLSTRFSPFPSALFREYLASQPRNVCELFIGLRRAPETIHSLLSDQSIRAPIREGLEREQNLDRLGWALLIMFAFDKVNAWSILEKTNVAGRATEDATRADATQVALFLHNLRRISKPKGQEWVEGIAPKELAEILERLQLRYIANSLKHILRFSPRYFETLVEQLSPSVMCEKVLSEDDEHKLKTSLAMLCILLGGRVNVRAVPVQDFSGEWSTRLSFYFKQKSIVRVLPGRRRGIPFANSARQELLHWDWIVQHCKQGCEVVINRGAASAIAKRCSLFPVGVLNVVGDFEVEDIVEIRDDQGACVGAAVTNFDSGTLNRIKGLRADAVLSTGVTPNRVFDNDRTAFEVRRSRLRQMVEGSKVKDGSG